MNASGKTFTVRSSLQLYVDRNDDGVAYTCKVDHVALTQTPQQATEVLEVHCECTHTQRHAHPQIHTWSVLVDPRGKEKYLKEEVTKLPYVEIVFMAAKSC